MLPLSGGVSLGSLAAFPVLPGQNAQAQGWEIGQAIRDIFNCPSLANAGAMLHRVTERFAKENPQWVKWLENNIAEGFAVYRFARSTQKKIRTVNGLERVNKEIRCRTRVVGIFPNEDSVLRLISAVLADIHEEWLTGRQDLNLAEGSTMENPVSQSNYRKSVA